MSWLEEVDLIVAREKRFFFVDPILRLWLGIYGHGVLPSETELRQKVDGHLESRGAKRAEENLRFPPPPSDDFVEID